MQKEGEPVKDKPVDTFPYSELFPSQGKFVDAEYLFQRLSQEEIRLLDNLGNLENTIRAPNETSKLLNP